jgi:hypothetical protein
LLTSNEASCPLSWFTQQSTQTQGRRSRGGTGTYAVSCVRAGACVRIHWQASAANHGITPHAAGDRPRFVARAWEPSLPSISPHVSPPTRAPCRPYHARTEPYVLPSSLVNHPLLLCRCAGRSGAGMQQGEEETGVKDEEEDDYFMDDAAAAAGRYPLQASPVAMAPPPAGAVGRRRVREEQERTKLRERQRRAVTGRILAGLRQHGNYSLRARADINEVIAALAREAGWVVLPDGTTFPTSAATSEVCLLSVRCRSGGLLAVSALLFFFPRPLSSARERKETK